MMDVLVGLDEDFIVWVYFVILDGFVNNLFFYMFNF